MLVVLLSIVSVLLFVLLVATACYDDLVIKHNEAEHKKECNGKVNELRDVRNDLYHESIKRARLEMQYAELLAKLHQINTILNPEDK